MNAPTWEEIAAAESLGIYPNEVVYIGGSSIDGLGNPWSDIDVFVISDRLPAGPNLILNDGQTTSIHFFGGGRIDYEFWSPNTVETLATRLDAYKPDSGVGRDDFTIGEQQFINRIHAARPMIGNVVPWRDRLDCAKLRTFQLHSTVLEMDNAYEDLCGMIVGGDWQAALLRGRDLIDYSLKANLHFLGSTVPTMKWRAKLLERFDVRFDLRAEFWLLQFPSQTVLVNAQDRQDYIERCVRFSQKILQIVQNDRSFDQ
jgi:Nucleotidyltransferase domain